VKSRPLESFNPQTFFPALGGRFDTARRQPFTFYSICSVRFSFGLPSGISGALMFVAVIKFHHSHIFNKPCGRFDFQLQAKVPFSRARLNGNQFDERGLLCA
jgi:hypothetical protein